MPKVGVLRLSALGDAVLTIPLIETLIASSRFSEVVWITTRPVVELLGPIKKCRFVVVEKTNSLASFYRNWAILRNENLETLILAQASFSAHLVSILVKTKRKIGFDVRRGKDLHRFFINESIPYRDEHFVEAYLSFAAKLRVPPKADLSYWSSAFKHIDLDFGKKFRFVRKFLVLVNPCPSKCERRWTLEGYRLLIKTLLECNCSPVIIGGNDAEEQSFNLKVAEGLGSRVPNLTGSLNLKNWVSLLKEADLVIAPDTGVIHLANALGTPVIGLYAVANPLLTGPFKNLQNSVNKYPEAVKMFESVKPRDFHHRVHDKRAMQLIKFEDVWNKVSSILGNLSQND
jgi:heptosyltransferase I